jgi:hypothetical protein
MIYGLIAEFDTKRALVEGVRKARSTGYRRMDAFSPVPIDGLAELLGSRWDAIPLLVLIAGIFGGIGAFLLQWHAMVIAYPLNVGGRPLNSWPLFIPITFELTILCAAITALISMLVLNKLPKLYHPVFNVRGFERASVDRYFLLVETSDRLFEVGKTSTFLRTLEPLRVEMVEA